MMKWICRSPFCLLLSDGRKVHSLLTPFDVGNWLQEGGSINDIVNTYSVSNQVVPKQLIPVCSSAELVLNTLYFLEKKLM